MSDTGEIDRKLADAILDMDDIAFGEGMGVLLDDPGREEAWDKLVLSAQAVANRVCHRNRHRKDNG